MMEGVSAARLASLGANLLDDDRGIRIAGWEIEGTKAPIAGDEALQDIETKLGGKLRLPEQVFAGSMLAIRHRELGLEVNFTAEDALRGWVEEGLPPVQVSVAKEWQASRKEEMQGKVHLVEYDWTYTSNYQGTYRAQGGSKPFPEWTESTEHGIDRGMLMTRDPILWYAEIPLYESEMDDNGVCQMVVKVRVMPSCWLVLLRFFLRVDGVLVRLREGFLRTGISTTQTRLFAKWEDAQKGSSRVVRETRWAHGSKEALAAGGAAISSRAFADAESAAQALGAMAPACLDTFKVEVVEL